MFRQFVLTLGFVGHCAFGGGWSGTDVHRVSLYLLDDLMGSNLCSYQWQNLSNLVCNSSASRDCRNMGYAGGVLQEWNVAQNEATEICVVGSTQTVSFKDLSRVFGSNACSGSDWHPAKTLFCTSAASRYCREQGHSGGMLQEHDSANRRAVVVCTRGVVEHVSTYVLQRLNPYCTENWNDTFNPMGCASAASRYCRNRGFKGGVIQEYNSPGHQAVVMCMN